MEKKKKRQEEYGKYRIGEEKKEDEQNAAETGEY